MQVKLPLVLIKSAGKFHQKKNQLESSPTSSIIDIMIDLLLDVIVVKLFTDAVSYSLFCCFIMLEKCLQQMDSIEMDQAEKLSEETVDGELLLSDASDPHDIFGSPLVDPRVGDEYQAEIPPMSTQSPLHELSVNPIHSEAVTNNASFAFLMGLPIPITWICKEANTFKEEHKKILHEPSNKTCSNHFPNPENGPKSEGPLNKKAENSKVDMTGCFPVPDLSPEPWDDFEVEAFTLGLYIFGKNLLQVQKFMESKDLGKIQSFYYGRFYKSPRYCRWVDCRKMRNKKCIMGSKIFTGCRQQELLSRLLPHLSEESNSSLQEASNALVEERTSLEEYVATLKRMLGIRALVEAVGIGKGKEDLTTLITDNSKSCHRLRVRPPELPSGKACSSLTTAEIIKFLTSDFRLSKARANDLFWEAVWPRLLAKGWHSEQPKDICTAPKNNLVFLMPGVKKFSRRKLMNRIHYFDSVSDVLSKVASEPQLLDLEAQEPGSSKEEDDDDAVDHVDRQKDRGRHCYLKPQVVTNHMKFTVIDTSLPSKVRELRSLPVEKRHLSVAANQSRENGRRPLGHFNISSLENSNSSNCCKGLPNGKVRPKKRIVGPIKKPAEKQEDHLNASLSADQQVRSLKQHLSCRGKPGRSNHMGPVMKRQRLSACESTDMGLKQEEASCVLSLHATTDKNLVRECSFQREGSLSSSPSAVNQTDMKISAKCDTESKPLAQPQLLIDLNLPHVPVEPIYGDQLKMEDGDITVKSEPLQSSVSGEDTSEEGQNASARRHSTRNRPLTTKALEALEIGLLSLRDSRKHASPRSLDHKTRLPKQTRSDEASYGDIESDKIIEGKMDVVSIPLIQNNETAWPVNC